MDGLIGIAAIVLILAYIATAVWTICKRQTVAGTLGTSACFLGGAFVVEPIAKVVAAVVCWGAVIGLVLVIIACMSE